MKWTTIVLILLAVTSFARAGTSSRWLGLLANQGRAIPTHGLVAWFDAAVLSTTTTDSSNNVERWDAVYPSGVYLIQTNVSFRPVLTEINGEHAIDTDSAYLEMNETINVTNETLFAVFVRPGYSDEVYPVNNSAGGFRYRDTDARYFLAGGEGVTLSENRNGTLCWVGVANPTPTLFRQNGTTLSTSYISGNSAYLSGIEHVGYRLGTGKGIIAEILLYDRALSLSEIQEIENYLMEKWGI